MDNQNKDFKKYEEKYNLFKEEYNGGGIELLKKSILLKVSKSQIQLKLPVIPEMLNYFGSVYGAVSATIIEGLGVVFHYLVYEELVINISFTINFSGTAKLGDYLIITSELDKNTKSIIFMKHKIECAKEDKLTYDENDLTLMVSSVGTLKRFKNNENQKISLSSKL